MVSSLRAEIKQLEALGKVDRHGGQLEGAPKKVSSYGGRKSSDIWEGDI